MMHGKSYEDLRDFVARYCLWYSWRWCI
jgi:hypothetical protein